MRLERVIKTCEGCNEQDLIEVGKRYCDDCIEKRKQMRKELLNI